MMTLSDLRKRAREMKASPTESEDRAERLLKKAKIPYKTQVLFGYYILDFLITNRLLVLEIDGGYHKDRAYKDKIRDVFCEEYGLQVLRVKNEDVSSVVRRVRRFKKIKDYNKKWEKIKRRARERQQWSEKNYPKSKFS